MSILGPRNLIGMVASKTRKLWDDVATDELQRRGKRHAVAEPVGQDEAFFRGVDPETQSTMKERVWSVNLEKIQAPEDVLNTIRDVGQIAEDPSKVITWGETTDLSTKIAHENGLNPKHFAQTANAQGWNTANLQAARQTMIEGATQVRDMAQMIQGKRAAGGVTDADLLGFRQLLARHVAMQQTYSGMASEAGRQLNILKSTVSANGVLYKGQVEDALNAMGGKDFSLDIIDTLADMDNLAAMNKTALAFGQPGAKDMVHELWINGLLSGVRTQGVNFLGNMLARGFENFEQVWAGAIGDSVNVARRLAGKDLSPHASLADVSPMLYGELKGFLDGLRIFGKTFVAGESSFDQFTKIEFDQVARTQASATSANIANLFGARAPTGMLAKSLDFFFDYSPVAGRLPTRLMTATDDFFKSIGYRTQAEMGARRMAREEAMQVGKGSDSAWIANRSQELIRDMPEDLHKLALEEARRGTFTDPLTGGIWGQLGDAARGFRSLPIGKYIVPFARTPINLFKWAAQRSPIGVFDGEVQAAIKAGGVRADEAVGRIAAGSSLMTAGVLFYEMGMVSGPGPGKDGRELSRTLQRQEFMPRSLILAGEMFEDGQRRTVNISRADPVGMLFGAAADVKDVMFWADDEETRDQIAIDIGVAMSRMVQDKTFLTGVSDFISAMDDPDRKMGAWMDRLGGSFVPTILSDVNRDLVDQTAREVNSVLDSWCSRLPGCSDTLPPKRNLYGDPVTYDDFNMFSPLQVSVDQPRDTDDVDVEMLRNRVQVQELPRTWKGVDLRDVRLEDESGARRSAYERWQELSGRGVKFAGKNLVQTLNELLKSELYQLGTDGPDGTKALDIKSEFAHYRAIAFEQVVLEFPELRERFLDVRADEARQRMDVDTGDMELQLIEQLSIPKTSLFQ